MKWRAGYTYVQVSHHRRIPGRWATARSPLDSNYLFLICVDPGEVNHWGKGMVIAKHDARVAAAWREEPQTDADKLALTKALLAHSRGEKI
jgi:hypothetical protein